jgi:hypothetical protein
MNDETKTCCICEAKFTEWGNNPAPFGNGDGAKVCCNDCNDRFVIPARLIDRRLNVDEKAFLCYFARTGRQFVTFTTAGRKTDDTQ